MGYLQGFTLRSNCTCFKSHYRTFSIHNIPYMEGMQKKLKSQILTCMRCVLREYRSLIKRYTFRSKVKIHDSLLKLFIFVIAVYGDYYHLSGVHVCCMCAYELLAISLTFEPHSAKMGLNACMYVSSQISLCSLHRLFRDVTFLFNGIFYLKEVYFELTSRRKRQP